MPCPLGWHAPLPPTTSGEQHAGVPAMGATEVSVATMVRGDGRGGFYLVLGRGKGWRRRLQKLKGHDGPFQCPPEWNEYIPKKNRHSESVPHVQPTGAHGQDGGGKPGAVHPDGQPRVCPVEAQPRRRRAFHDPRPPSFAIVQGGVETQG